MKLLACYIFAFCVAVVKIKNVTGLNSFIALAPFVEYFIKEHADKTIESYYQMRNQCHRIALKMLKKNCLQEKLTCKNTIL